MKWQTQDGVNSMMACIGVMIVLLFGTYGMFAATSFIVLAPSLLLSVLMTTFFLLLVFMLGRAAQCLDAPIWRLSFLLLIILQYCSLARWGGSVLIYTPFSGYSSVFLSLDRAMGFDLVGLMRMTHAYPWAVSLLRWAYETIDFQLVLLPLFVACFDYYLASRYFCGYVIGLVIASLIYIFIPSTCPAEVLSSPYFTPTDHFFVREFFQAQHHAAVTWHNLGIIGFPSYHVIVGVLVLRVFYRRYWLFLPLLLVNVLMIFSTLALGYHFLVDVIGGVLVAFLADGIAVKGMRWATLQRVKKEALLGLSPISADK